MAGNVTPGNLAMGPGDLYVAAFGAPEPLPQQINGTPASSAWTAVGGTQGGITLNTANTWKELDVDQIVETPARRLTKREHSIKTNLAEVTFANYVIAMSGGTISSDAAPLGGGTAYDEYVDDDVNSGDEPDYKAVLFDGWGSYSGTGGLRRRVILRKCINTDNVEIKADKDGQTVYAVTFNSHYVSSAIRSRRTIQARA